MSTIKTPTNELKRLNTEEFKKSKKTPVIIVLDNIRSMLNVGSIFRTGDAFAIHKLYLCGITPRPPHREIHKTALGSENAIDWEYAQDVTKVLNDLKNEGAEMWADCAPAEKLGTRLTEAPLEFRRQRLP